MKKISRCTRSRMHLPGCIPVSGVRSLPDGIKERSVKRLSNSFYCGISLAGSSFCLSLRFRLHLLLFLSFLPFFSSLITRTCESDRRSCADLILSRNCILCTYCCSLAASSEWWITIVVVSEFGLRFFVPSFLFTFFFSFLVVENESVARVLMLRGIIIVAFWVCYNKCYNVEFGSFFLSLNVSFKYITIIWKF